MHNADVRPKLPPYGRALLAARDAAAARRECLEPVCVFYGADPWRHAKDCLSIIMPAQEYETGKYDWTLIAGLKIEVIWIGGDRVQELAAEIAAHAAPVTIITKGKKRDVADFLFTYRPRPCWWSIEDEADYERRARLYNRFLAADLGALDLTEDDRREAVGD